MSRFALPFLTLSDEAVRVDEWWVGALGEPLHPLADILENWDYEKDIQVRTTVEVDFQRAARDLDMPVSDLRLRVVLSLGTGAGSFPRRSEILFLEELSSKNPTCVIEQIVMGKHLSGRMLLDLRVVLDAPLNSGGELSPKRQGSRLWILQKNVLIEDGGDTRFPVEMVSFAQGFNGQPGQDAPWRLDWMPYALDAEFSGNVRLYVNTDYPATAERFEQGDPATLQAMVADAMGQLIDVIIEGDTLRLEDYDEGAVGWQAVAWAKMAFPGKSAGDIRELKQRYPGRYRAAILSAAEIGDEE